MKSLEVIKDTANKVYEYNLKKIKEAPTEQYVKDHYEYFNAYANGVSMTFRIMAENEEISFDTYKELDEYLESLRDELGKYYF
ncbi:MAG: hypothetical protein K6G88_05825 [Lachnospiraceae bacterium]|nr:hypothetical protein [Lachnospiraceae bacterium]